MGDKEWQCFNCLRKMTGDAIVDGRRGEDMLVCEDCHCEEAPNGFHHPDWNSIEVTVEKGKYYVSVRCLYCGAHGDLISGTASEEAVSW